MMWSKSINANSTCHTQPSKEPYHTPQISVYSALPVSYFFIFFYSDERSILHTFVRLPFHAKVTTTYQMHAIMPKCHIQPFKMYVTLTSRVRISCCVSSTLVAHCVLSPSKRFAEMSIMDCTATSFSNRFSWWASLSAITYIVLAAEIPHIWKSANSPLLTLQIRVFEVNTLSRFNTLQNAPPSWKGLSPFLRDFHNILGKVDNQWLNCAMKDDLWWWSSMLVGESKDSRGMVQRNHSFYEVTKSANNFVILS